MPPRMKNHPNYWLQELNPRPPISVLHSGFRPTRPLGHRISVLCRSCYVMEGKNSKIQEGTVHFPLERTRYCHLKTLVAHKKYLESGTGDFQNTVCHLLLWLLADFPHWMYHFVTLADYKSSVPCYKSSVLSVQGFAFDFSRKKIAFPGREKRRLPHLVDGWALFQLQYCWCWQLKIDRNKTAEVIHFYHWCLQETLFELSSLKPTHPLEKNDHDHYHHYQRPLEWS